MWNYQYSYRRGYSGPSHAIIMEVKPFDGQEEVAHCYVSDWGNVSGKREIFGDLSLTEGV